MFGRSVRLLIYITLSFVLLILWYPSSLAVCGHHLSPRMGIVFSLLFALHNNSSQA